MRKLIAIHLGANALLLWLGYYWLGLGETRAATLAWSALVALLLVTLACWLHGATFAWFREKRLFPLRRLPLLVGSAIALLAIYAVLIHYADFGNDTAFKIASWLTLTFRKPVKPATVLSVLHGIFWLVRWMVVPAAALPILASIAARGWPGARWQARQWWYWIAVPILLVCAFWAPLRLMGWTPYSGHFSMEMFSFVLRLLAAYLLFVGAWLLLAFLTSGGSPRATQSSTMVSP